MNILLQTKNKTFLAILSFSLSCLMAVLMISLSRYATLKYNIDTNTILALRYIMMLTLWFPSMIKNRFLAFRAKGKSYLLLRDFLSILVLVSFYKFSIFVPISNSTIISFTTPIFAILLWSLKEGKKPSNIVISASVFSLVGVAIAVGGITNDKIGTAYLLLLLFSLVRGVINVMSKSVSQTQGIALMMQSNAVIGTLVSVITLTIFGSISSIFDVKVLVIAIISLIMHQIYYACFLFGIRNTSMEVVQPFDFLRIIFSALIGIFFFEESITINIIFGSVIVISSVYFSTKYATKEK